MSVLPLPVTPWSNAASNFPATSQRQISSSAAFCSAFSTFAGGVKSVSHGSSSAMIGSSQVCSQPFFSSRRNTLRETPACSISRFQGIGPRVAVSTSRIFSSAGVSGAPSVAAFHATIFCRRVFRRSAPALQPFYSRRGNRLLARVGVVKMSQKFQLGALHIGFFAVTAEVFQVGAPCRGQPVLTVVPQLNFRWKRRAKCFTNRRQIITADPVSKLDQLRGQRRDGIEYLHNLPHPLHIGRLGSHRQHHAHHRPVAKRHQHPPPYQLFAVQRFRHRVRKYRTQRHGQRHFTISLSHCRSIV